MVEQTSLEAWEHIKDTGRIGRQQAIVYDCLLEHEGLTDREVAALTGLRINCVTPRRGELVKLGLVVQDGHKWEAPRAKLWRARQ